jgi:ribosomal protein S15P/S13E
MKRKQIDETQERSLGDLVGNIQEVIDYLEEKKKGGGKP